MKQNQLSTKHSTFPMVTPLHFTQSQKGGCLLHCFRVQEVIDQQITCSSHTPRKSPNQDLNSELLGPQNIPARPRPLGLQGHRELQFIKGFLRKEIAMWDLKGGVSKKAPGGANFQHFKVGGEKFSHTKPVCFL